MSEEINQDIIATSPQQAQDKSAQEAAFIPTEIEQEAQPVESVETPEAVETVESVETDETAETVESVETDETVETVESVETPEAVETAETAQNVETAEVVEKVEKKEKFKLTKPQNFDELAQKMCCKRGRKLIYRPEEALFEATFTVLGTDKKNEEGYKVKDILDAEIKEGVKLGYIDKFDGLKTAEIKEEYENDTIYEYAEQEFRKMGVIAEGDKVKVYVYDWDRVGMHHIGYIDSAEFAPALKYFENKEEYSFDLCGIITGGKSKTVTRDEKGKYTILKEKGDNIGVELDITVINRKD